MLFAVLAGLSALVWGVADFSGGKASQRADPLSVVCTSKLVSLPLLGTVVLLVGARPDPATLAWGALAGVLGTAGTVAFYRALSAGAMAVVAPVTSVTSAGIPVVIGLADGEHPSATALGGVLCALVAVTLVSLAAPPVGSRSRHRRLVGLAAGAGLGFALFMVCLAMAARTAHAGSAPSTLLASHLVGVLLAGAVLLVPQRTGTRRVRPRGSGLAWVGAAGVLDTTGSAAYLVASARGDLSLVAPIAALYPVTTVLLALLVERERPRRAQVVGLLLAVAALDLVARPAA